MAAEGSSSEHHSVLYGPVNRLWESSGLAEMTGAHHVPDHVVMALLVLVLVAVVFIPLRARLKSEAALERPGKGQQLLELVVLALRNLMEDVIGHGAAKRFMPMIGALAFFIFLCNILGLFFFLQPPTGNTNTTFALSITAWLYYHVVGIKKHGLGYFKQFLGPIPALFFLFIPLELISHLARAFSLGLRLFGNIFGEHLAASVFFMIPFIVPFPMMALGIFGATLQAFIFCMLTMVYIAGAEAEEH
jgi:F-type H+-transporting ATPase subunit a